MLFRSFFDLMPITEAFSVFLFSLALYLLKHRSKFIWLTLPFIIFQREFLLVLLMIYVILEIKRFKIRFTGLFVIISILLLAFYVLLRNYYFLNPYLQHQTDINNIKVQMFHLGTSFSTYLKQLLIALNLFIVYIGVFFYNRFNGKDRKSTRLNSSH